MNLFPDFEARIKTALEQIDLVKEKRSELDFGRIAVEPPRDVTHGDVATNAAMVLAKPLGGLKVLGNGALTAKLELRVWGASASAKAAIEKAGGSVTILAPSADAEAADA